MVRPKWVRHGIVEGAEGLASTEAEEKEDIYIYD